MSVTLIQQVRQARPIILDLQDLQEGKYTVSVHCNGLLQNIDNLGYDSGGHFVILGDFISFLNADNELIIQIHGQNVTYERKVSAANIPVSDVACRQMVLGDVLVVDRERNTDNVELGYL
jgi:hypothetical protein